MFTLENKTMLVTGASGGIGGAIVDQLHAAGAHVIASGSNEGKLASFVEKYSERVTPLVCNLGQVETVEQFAKEAEDISGGLHGVVCNAGITRDTLAMRMKDEDWQQVMDINLTSTFHLVRALLKGMMKRRAGRMILITSVVGHTGNAGQVNYCATKAGLTGMAKALAHEVASRGITVNCVAPGFIATPMTDVLTDEQKARISGNIPMQRMGSPEDVASAVTYLSTDAAAYVTGQTIHVNGGLYMG